MQSPIAFIALLGLAGLSFSALGYTTDFEDPPFDPLLDVAGQDGWVINDPVPALSFIETMNGSAAAGIGGFYDEPSILQVMLTHPYGSPLADTFFELQFDIEPSTLDFPGRDSFGFSFRDPSNSPLLEVIFLPNVNFADRLEVLWSGLGGAPTSTGFDLFYSSSYDLKIDFGSSGSNGTFSATLEGADSISWNGTLAGAGSSTIGSFGADWGVDPSAPTAGDNFMLFDNVNVSVPEFGSTLPLLGLSLGMMSIAARRGRNRVLVG